MSEDARHDGKDNDESGETTDAPESEGIEEAGDAAPADAADEVTPDDDVAGDEPAAPEPGVTAKKPSRMPLLLAILAFLIALGSAASVGLLWTRQGPDLSGQFDGQLRELTEQLNATSSELQRTEQSLEELRNSSSQASGGLDSLQRTLDQRLRSLEAVPGRLSNLESSLSALQGISSGLRDTWLLAETEYYLQIANAQMQLAGNAELARIALALGDERLASLGNPALTDVRREIAGEMRDLDAMAAIDMEGAVLTLGSLADAIQTLPLKNDIKVPVADELPLDGEQSGMDRALASLKSSLSDVISVRRSDAAVKPLLPPDAAYFLRNNLALQLQTARLAMLRGEQSVFDGSLDDASTWLGEYYDTDSKPVQSALETIDELRAMQLTIAKPDISGSLAALRQFMALRSEADLIQPESGQ